VDVAAVSEVSLLLAAALGLLALLLVPLLELELELLLPVAAATSPGASTVFACRVAACSSWLSSSAWMSI
jgi:hypothetical protein